ncbi:hypothetical protein GW17_00048300 [Ensete ventricosum]|nr:hypothetical protein GW17_00048300 [Ensete ventricosum]
MRPSSSSIVGPLLISVILHATFHNLAAASPLFTDGRWIVDASGTRVKLACVNWPSHLELMLAEGLSKQPLASITWKIYTMGFNCVRLTYPTFLLTNESLASLTVRQSFEIAGLDAAIPLIALHNPTFVDLNLLHAYKVTTPAQAVVAKLGANNIMVILDNHISKPGWCCSNSDGNGFFGDTYFDPNVWYQGLIQMATMFKGAPNVVGMSLRNELRGPRQNVDDWFTYMQKGAEAVHGANPDVLVVLSGLSFDNDLGFLASRHVDVSFQRKLVFEVHWYAFSNGDAWVEGNPNKVCGSISGSVNTRAGFLLDRQLPLFVSEYGVDQRGGNLNDNRYLGCILAFLADKDVDWALWTLQGSYYLREGVVDKDEAYGMLTYDWAGVRNQTVLQKVRAVQQPFRGPGVSKTAPYIIIFHPSTGLCVTLGSLTLHTLDFGPCDGNMQAFHYTQQRTLTSIDSSLCVSATGAGDPVKFDSCSDSGSSWNLVSDSGMHVSTTLPGDGTTLCLDVGPNGVVTNPCKCLGDDANCDPESQWFKLVTSAKTIP